MDKSCEMCNMPIKSAQKYEEIEKELIPEKVYVHSDCYWKAKLIAFFEGVGMQEINELIEKKPSELKMIGSFLADKIQESVRATENIKYPG